MKPAAIALLLGAAAAALMLSKKGAAASSLPAAPAGAPLYPGSWITYANITIAPPTPPAPGGAGPYVNLMDQRTTPPVRTTVQIQALAPDGTYSGDVTGVGGVMTTAPSTARFTLANVAQMASDGLGTPIDG